MPNKLNRPVKALSVVTPPTVVITVVGEIPTAHCYNHLHLYHLKIGDCFTGMYVNDPNSSMLEKCLSYALCH